MNKFLLSSAVAVLAMAVSPAFAQDDSTLKLNLGGHFKGYANYSSQDDEFTGTDVRDFDFLRQTEVHFGGETTLDNGLTVGAQIETLADAGDSFEIDESYIYMAGSWGRVNVGDEDGAAYLLQVAAPSADDNIDGIRQFIAPLNLGGVALAGGAFSGVGEAYAGGLDYDNDLAGNSDKVTYLTPVFSGFQAGLSYTPQVDGAETITGSRGGNGNLVDTDGTGVGYEDVVEAALRWEGSYNNVGMILGGGYTWAIEDDNNEWNVGADLDFGPFGLGAVYTQNDYASELVTGDDDDAQTWVVGADYTTGPFKLGASYLGSDVEDGYEANRFSGGVIYTYGPGMSFRGSVAYTDLDVDTAAGGGDADAVTATVGTQINF